MESLIGCPKLRRVILGSQDGYGVTYDARPNADNLKVSFMDIFSSRGAPFELCRIALRIEKAIYEATIQCLEIGDTEIAFEYARSEEISAPLEHVTVELVVADGRVVPGKVWQEVCAIDEGLQAPGMGSRDMTLSKEAWGRLSEWVEAAPGPTKGSVGVGRVGHGHQRVEEFRQEWA